VQRRGHGETSVPDRPVRRGVRIPGTVLAANEPEAAATDALAADLDRQGFTIAELHVDRGYLASALVRDRPPERAVVAKA
jgi:hypothetical protein